MCCLTLLRQVLVPPLVHPRWPGRPEVKGLSPSSTVSRGSRWRQPSLLQRLALPLSVQCCLLRRAGVPGLMGWGGEEAATPPGGAEQHPELCVLCCPSPSKGPSPSWLSTPTLQNQGSVVWKDRPPCFLCSSTLTYQVKGAATGPCLLSLCSDALVLSGHAWSLITLSSPVGHLL